MQFRITEDRFELLDLLGESDEVFHLRDVRVQHLEVTLYPDLTDGWRTASEATRRHTTAILDTLKELVSGAILHDAADGTVAIQLG